MTRTGFSAALLPLLVGALLDASRPLARADDLSDFETARSAYAAQNFPLAVQRFEALVGGAIPALSSRPLVLESRKYLAAAYLFVGRRPAAERQFGLLLADDPTYQIDPVAFPAEVIDAFNAARAQYESTVRSATEARERAEQEARRREAERLIREREHLSALVALAETETETREHSRWIALIPFGVGQFQNGHDGAGVAFAVSEGALAIVSIVTYFLHEAIRGDVQPLAVGTTEPAGRRDSRLAATALRATNWIATGVLGAVVLGGIVDAELRFVPEVRTTRHRPLPRELHGPGLSVGIGPTSVQASLQF